VSEGVQITFPPELLDAIIDAVTERVLDRGRDRDDDGDRWPEWLSIATAATYMDVSAERVRKLIARGELPHYQEAANCRILLRRAEVDAWLESFRR
jgi:excisionase family DNA binding protein